MRICILYTVFVAMMITFCAQASAVDRLYVLLDTAHPDFNPQQCQWVSSGFVSYRVLAKDFPAPKYTITETPPAGCSQFFVKTKAEKMAGLFDKHPPAIRAQFYIHRAAVKEALANKDYEAARLIIEGVSVPPALEADKQKLLDTLKE